MSRLTGVRFAVRAMTAADAHAIAAWRYPAAYAFYDADADPAELAELLDPAGWGVRWFAVDDDELVGLFVFKLQDGQAEVGLGLRPDLTGRGLGLPFVQAGLRFAEQALGATSFTLAVAAFNERAITVYERAGFVAGEHYLHATNGALHDFVRMTRGRLPAHSPAGWRAT